MSALGIAVLILGLACVLPSWIAVIRLGSRPMGHDEAWELSRKRAFLASYPAALLIAVGTIILFFSRA
jgi:hypothetical protein